MNWFYYPDNRKKDDPPNGPFSLDQLVAMIQEGKLREDTFVVREEPKECHYAYIFPEISEKIPLNIEMLTETYLATCNQSDWPDEDWWAWDKANDLVLWRPDLAWKLILAMVARARSDHELWYVGTGLLERLLENHGSDYIEAVEQRANSDIRFRHCLGGVDNILSDDTIWERVQKACREPSPP